MNTTTDDQKRLICSFLETSQLPLTLFDTMVQCNITSLNMLFDGFDDHTESFYKLLKMIDDENTRNGLILANYDRRQHTYAILNGEYVLYVK